MKETRFFYVPQATTHDELPSEEALHALKVLRLKNDDEITIIDGTGSFHQARLIVSGSRECRYEIISSHVREREWNKHIHLAIAPTKMMERMEWLVEKATEIGVDRISFLNTQWTVRKTVKIERLNKIVISAVKQSHKAWVPIIDEMVNFKTFLSQTLPSSRCIAHCYEEYPRQLLFDVLNREAPSGNNRDALVLIGPEGDFSPEEVQMALDNGFFSVSLGKSRLRTETAGVSAIMQMHLSR